MQAFALFVEAEFDWFEVRALVRRVAEGLVLREAAGAVEVVLCAEYGFFNDVGADLGRDGECSIGGCVEAPFELVVLVLFDCDAATREKRRVQVIL